MIYARARGYEATGWILNIYINCAICVRVAHKTAEALVTVLITMFLYDASK